MAEAASPSPPCPARAVEQVVGSPLELDRLGCSPGAQASPASISVVEGVP